MVKLGVQSDAPGAGGNRDRWNGYQLIRHVDLAIDTIERLALNRAVGDMEVGGAARIAHGSGDIGVGR